MVGLNGLIDRIDKLEQKQDISSNRKIDFIYFFPAQKQHFTNTS